MTTFFLAQEASLTEFAKDPALTVAAVLLITVSILWIIVARLITLNLRRAAARRSGRKRRKAPKEVWDSPP